MGDAEGLVSAKISLNGNSAFPAESPISYTFMASADQKQIYIGKRVSDESTEGM